MIVNKFESQYMCQNTYLVWCGTTFETVLIDSGEKSLLIKPI